MKASYGASAFHPLGESHFRPLRPFRPLCPPFDESPKIQLPNLGLSIGVLYLCRDGRNGRDGRSGRKWDLPSGLRVRLLRRQ